MIYTKKHLKSALFFMGILTLGVSSTFAMNNWKGLYEDDNNFSDNSFFNSYVIKYDDYLRIISNYKKETNTKLIETLEYQPIVIKEKISNLKLDHQKYLKTIFLPHLFISTNEKIQNIGFSEDIWKKIGDHLCDPQDKLSLSQTSVALCVLMGRGEYMPDYKSHFAAHVNNFNNFIFQPFVLTPILIWKTEPVN